jgi:integrase
MAKIWLTTYKSSLRAATITMYRNAYNTHIMPSIGNIPIKAVKAVHIQQIMSACANASESLQHKILLTLNQIFKSAQTNHLIGPNPCEGIKITKHAAPEKAKHLTPEQQTSLIESINDPRAKVFAGLCLYCGLRREEALGVQWSDIRDGSLTVNRAVPFIGNQPDRCRSLKQRRPTALYRFPTRC